MSEPVRSGGDAFGRALGDYLETGDENLPLVIRVEDGNVEEMPSSHYFETFDSWSPLDRALIQWVSGRVLDVGAGAGRVSLYLQTRGHDVTAIDLSPGAIEVCRRRGVKDVRDHNILGGPLNDEKFDSILLFGMNLGIAGTHNNVSAFIGMLGSMLKPGGRIIGTQVNWDRTKNENHLQFQESQRALGKYPVEMTLRISYKGIDEDFSWCLTKQEELREYAKENALSVEAIIDCGGIYGFVLANPKEPD